MSPMTTSNPMLFKIAGCGAFMSVGFFLTGFSINLPSDKLSESPIFLSPTLPLLPIVLAFHQLQYSHSRQWNQVIRLIGVIGATSILALTFVLLIYYGFGWFPQINSLTLSIIMLCLVGCMGLWLVLSGGLALRTKILPRPLAGLSIMVGITWLIVMKSILVNIFNPSMLKSLTGLWNANALALVWSYLLWMVWIGYFFLGIGNR